MRVLPKMSVPDQDAARFINYELLSEPIRRIDYTTGDEIDLILIHRAVLSMLFIESRRVNELDDKITAEMNRIAQPQSRIERAASLQRITDYINEKSQIENRTKFNNYFNKTGKLIDQFLSIKSTPKTIRFGVSGAAKSKGVDPTMQSLILEYLSVVADFIYVQITRPVRRLACCAECGESLVGVEPQAGLIVCPGCGAFEPVGQHKLAASDKESDNLDDISKSSSEERDNFRRCLCYIQGKQRHKVTTDLLQSVDNYCTTRNLPSAPAVNVLPLIRGGLGRGNTNVKFLRNVLKEIKRTDHYDDVFLIGFMLWKWKLPDLDSQEFTILGHYDKTQSVLHSLNTDKRNLNTKFRAWKHLQLVGYDYTREDLGVSLEIVEAQDPIWRQMCEGSGDSEIRYIPSK